MPVFKLRSLSFALSLSFPALSLLCSTVWAADRQDDSLPVVTVSDSKIDAQPVGATRLDEDQRRAASAGTGDTARLLGEIPGLQLYGAGGVSSLPVLHGLADDRLRIKVDGMDLISACANHMNPPLSYIDPSNVGEVQVFTGITPVSVGGDSIGGSILVNSRPPEFAKTGEGFLRKGQVGASYSSNGNGKAANASVTLANENLSLSYQGSTAEAGNYEAAQAFKSALSSAAVAAAAPKEVGSSLYQSQNQSLGLALRHEDDLFELKLGQQNIPYQGFPNQRMDMTRNTSDQVNLRYLGQYQWGALEARAYNENTRHTMNFLDNKLSTMGSLGMPMDTEGQNTGIVVKADAMVSQRDMLKLGGEFQRYRLNDWWDPVSTVPGMMAPNPFWNIRDGQRDRFDLFGEWEARWTAQWLSQVGLRSSTMAMDTGRVQGYNTLGGAMGYGDPNNPATIAGAFNALDHQRTDHNVDFSALARYTLDVEKTFEAGYSRKTRSPNLYERYTWSTNNNMVMNMINWAGDANGYVGNINLKPEVAHTFSATADWHDASRKQWGLQVTTYYSYIEDYIDAVACATVGKVCPVRTDNFVNLSFANQSARLYGMDISGYWPVATTRGLGAFTANGMLSYVKGKNATTDDNLYHTMPLNAKLALVQQIGNWHNTVELQWVDAKSDVSKVRNETQTAGYGLLNVRSSYDWKKARFDLGIENVLDRFYASPLGGAYVGQRQTGAVYGVPVAGPGRSIHVGVTVQF